MFVRILGNCIAAASIHTAVGSMLFLLICFLLRRLS